MRRMGLPRPAGAGEPFRSPWPALAKGCPRLRMVRTHSGRYGRSARSRTQTGTATATFRATHAARGRAGHARECCGHWQRGAFDDERGHALPLLVRPGHTTFPTTCRRTPRVGARRIGSAARQPREPVGRAAGVRVGVARAVRVGLVSTTPPVPSRTVSRGRTSDSRRDTAPARRCPPPARCTRRPGPCRPMCSRAGRW